MANLLPDQEPLISYTHSMRSRYSETDRMGYVYHGHYLEYFEVARTEFIRETGHPYSKLEDAGIMLPVFNAEIQYKKPIRYDELMHISVHIYEWPTVRFNTFYEINTDEGKGHNVLGKVELCFTDANKRRPIRVPLSFLNDFKKYVHEHA
ncbi:MAG: thioesterase family protein [Balneolales bacterium]